MDYKTDPMTDMNNEEPGHLHTPGRKKFDKRILIIVGCVIGVAAIAGGAFFFLSGKDADSGNKQTTTQQQAEVEEELPAPAADAADPQTFKSEKLNIEFTHRKDWVVKESTDKTQLTITSPKFAYQTKDGVETKGVFTLKIGIGASVEAQKTIDDAEAVKDSFLIAYDAPAAAQRHYTNISYAGQDDAFRFFIVTGSLVYKPGDLVAQTIEDSDFLIVGGYGTDEQNNLTFNSIDPADIEQAAAYEQAINIVKSLKVN